MELITNFRRNRAIKSFIKQLPGLLAKDYGKSKMYTPKQVKKTIERSGLSVANACYGIAMFSGRDAFEQYHQEMGENFSYVDMRGDIADKHFSGNSDFNVSDVASVSSSYGGGFDDGGSAGAGGSDGGGGSE